MKRLIFALVISVLNITCFSSTARPGLFLSDQLPANFEECNTYFDKQLTNEDKVYLKNLSYDNLCIEHKYLGMFIRNTWLRANRNPKLIHYLKALHISFMDDMSMMIIKSYWYHLHGIPFDVVKEINKPKIYKPESVEVTDSTLTRSTNTNH